MSSTPGLCDDMPMRIIGAGLGRTGSLSTKAALERLGAGPCHHMLELLAEHKTVDSFAAAARGEHVDWPTALAGYEATVDWPACAFHEQLAADFPDAKILLTVRDPDDWYESVRSTIYQAWLESRDGTGPVTGATLDVLRDVVWGERGTFRNRFHDRDWVLQMLADRTAAVQAAYPPERLLVHDVTDGWEPLCEFLGVEVLDEPYPKLNERAVFAAMVADRMGPDHADPASGLEQAASPVG